MAKESYKQKEGTTPGGRYYMSTTHKKPDGTTRRATVVEGKKVNYLKTTDKKSGVKAKLSEKSVTRENYNSSVEKPIGRGPKKPVKHSWDKKK